ncbi:hypothetical protein COOONC_06491 [Cooperia oncophora]
MYNPNLEWNNELSYEACYDLVGIEPNNIYVRLDGQRKFSGEERNWPLSKKVRLALRAGGGKDKVNALAPETIYGCNGLFEGDILKEWNNELSYEACYDLVGIEPNNIYVRLDGQRKFSGEERNWPLSKKVRLALRAGGGKDKVNALAPETIYGCNGLFEGDILKVLCLYRALRHSRNMCIRE